MIYFSFIEINILITIIKMNFLSYEELYEQLTSLADSDLMSVLNIEANFALKKQATELIFKSHHILSRQCNNYDDWFQKVTFFQYVSDFLNYLTILKDKN